MKYVQHKTRLWELKTQLWTVKSYAYLVCMCCYLDDVHYVLTQIYKYASQLL